MSRRHAVWPDEIVGYVTARGRVICRDHAGGVPEKLEAAVHVGDCPHSEDTCEIATCGRRLADLGAYWTPPDFPDRCRGARPPDAYQFVRREQFEP